VIDSKFAAMTFFFRRPARLVLLLALVSGGAFASEKVTIDIIEKRTVDVVESFTANLRRDVATHDLELTLVYFDATAWTHEEILAATVSAMELFGQCRVHLAAVETVRVSAPVQYHDLYTPLSRELARALQPARPTIYFVSDTRQQPAFDAEAIGRGNSRSRPELADSVWVTRATRDLGIVLAHELVHVLMNSGEHSDRPGNLMRDETAVENTQLTAAQCERLRDVGTRHGLLRRLDD